MRHAAVWIVIGFLAVQGVAGDRSSIWEVPHLICHPVIDGRLNEPEYASAFRWDGFVQTDPGYNTVPSGKTILYLFTTTDGVVIGIDCRDDRPDRIQRTRYRRDQMWNAERVEILLDTLGEARQFYVLGISPMNDVFDGFYDTANGANLEFDMMFEHGACISETGWTAEIFIPFSSLSFGEGKHDARCWFLVQRYIPREDMERDSILPVNRDSNAVTDGMASILLSRLPEATDARSRWKFIPSLVGSFLQTRQKSGQIEESGESFRGDVGLTVQWQPTAATSVKGTIHPDFSQVEADDTYQRINNRYPIYFSEKRPFFMDGMESFQTPFMLLHTRTIVRPELGVKFSTKRGDWGIFGISVQEQDVPGERFGLGEESHDTWWNIFRLTRALDNQGSYIGTLVTHRNFGSDVNRVISVDGLERWRKLNLSWQAAISEAENGDSKKTGNGLYLDIAYKQNQYWSSSIGYSALSPDFRDDAGFFQRVNYRRYYISQDWTYSPRTDRAFLKSCQIRLLYVVRYNYQSVMINQGPSLLFGFTLPRRISVMGSVDMDHEEYFGSIYETCRYDFHTEWNQYPRLKPYFSFSSGRSVLYGYNPRLVNMQNLSGGFSSEWEALSLDLSLFYYTLRERQVPDLIRRQVSLELVLNYVFSDRWNAKIFYISDLAVFMDYGLNEPYHYFNFLITWQKNAFSKIYLGVTNGRDNMRALDLSPLSFRQDRQVFFKVTWLF